MSLSKTNYID